MKAVPSDLDCRGPPERLTTQYVGHCDNVGGQRVLTVAEAAARLARTT